MNTQLLTLDEVKDVEHAAVAAGVAEHLLMERAGEGVAEVILEKFPPSPVVIFCGMGKNGGDGKIVARLLKEKDWPVEIISLEDLPPFETIEEAVRKVEWYLQSDPAHFLIKLPLGGSEVTEVLNEVLDKPAEDKECFSIGG